MFADSASRFVGVAPQLLSSTGGEAEQNSVLLKAFTFSDMSASISPALEGKTSQTKMINQGSYYSHLSHK